MTSRHWHRKTGPWGVFVALIALVTLAACGGTDVPPTANDAATVAAARAVTPTAAAGTTVAVTAGATGNTGGTGRGFGALLTPPPASRSTAQATVAQGAMAGGAGAAAPRGSGTPALAANSPQSNPLDPCTLVSPAELARAMGEPFGQADKESETPADTNTRLRGYSSALCVFAATGSTQTNARVVGVETIRRTPASAAPTGTGTFRTVADLWTFLKQQAQMGQNPAAVNGVGDDAVIFEDPATPGDIDVYARKGDVLLHILISGYAMDGRDKAVAVATQVAAKL